uniref:Uncharacterized protein n=1 Tax=Sander lucioperca TaxID=283035 RepID=A0A8D0ANL9_SANLU
RQYHYVLSTVGLTTACLKAAGTEPKLRQELKKVRRLDPMVLLKTSFTILAGTMSRGPLPGVHLRENVIWARGRYQTILYIKL